MIVFPAQVSCLQQPYVQPLYPISQINSICMFFPSFFFILHEFMQLIIQCHILFYFLLHHIS
jgi:hypothetical protein